MTLTHPAPPPSRPVARTRARAGSRGGLRVSAEGLVNVVLFATILTSFVVFIEPAPYEGMVGLLGLALLVAGARIDRLLAPMLALLAAWALFGAFSAMPVIANTEALIYYLVTVYLEISALVFAIALSENTERRLETLQRAYIVAAVIAALLGIIGYFRVIPGLYSVLTENDRARATFKDPNVFGPFLILPLLWLVQEFAYRGFRLRHVLAGLVIVFGLFLTFSRGAWGHAVISFLVMAGLMFLTSTDARFRRRLVVLLLAAVAGVALALMVLMSFSAVSEMFSQRAHLINYYDTGSPTGRFGRQLEGFLAIFDYPNGVGPKYFGIIFGHDPHNVYLATLYAHGWVGGFAYLALVVATLVIGLRSVMTPAPWQPALIAVYATFLGVALEGLIIDTDHWRHFFLLLGAVWGLSAATLRHRAVSRTLTPETRRSPA